MPVPGCWNRRWRYRPSSCRTVISCLTVSRANLSAMSRSRSVSGMDGLLDLSRDGEGNPADARGGPPVAVEVAEGLVLHVGDTARLQGFRGLMPGVPVQFVTSVADP